VCAAAVGGRKRGEDIVRRDSSRRHPGHQPWRIGLGGFLGALPAPFSPGRLQQEIVPRAEPGRWPRKAGWLRWGTVRGGPRLQTDLRRFAWREGGEDRFEMHNGRSFALRVEHHPPGIRGQHRPVRRSGAVLLAVVQRGRRTPSSGHYSLASCWAWGPPAVQPSSPSRRAELLGVWSAPLGVRRAVRATAVDLP